MKLSFLFHYLSNFPTNGEELEIIIAARCCFSIYRLYSFSFDVLVGTRKKNIALAPYYGQASSSQAKWCRPCAFPGFFVGFDFRYF